MLIPYLQQCLSTCSQTQPFDLQGRRGSDVAASQELGDGMLLVADVPEFGVHQGWS